MKILSDKLHGILDYLTVGAFLVAPTLFGLEGHAALLSYALSAIHFTMTALTNMELGIVRIIPMKLHSIIEMLVGPTLVLVGLLGGQILGADSLIFTAAGLAIIAVWFLSEYKGFAS
jgi:hypothetical protein